MTKLVKDPFCIFKEKTKAHLDWKGVVEDKWWYAQEYFHYLQHVYANLGVPWDYGRTKRSTDTKGEA